MMELSGDTPVTIIIKAPNQRLADQSIECMTGWTIKKLKQHLEIVYPTKPKHNEQRLIYSGRLLQDSQTLKEILRQYDESPTSTYTVHLVCSSVTDFSSPNSTASIVNGNSTQAAVSKPVASVSTGARSSETTNSSQTDGTRYRGHHQLPQPSNGHETANAHTAYTAYPSGVAQGDMTSYTPEQYNWMMQQQQQIYSQYMMQYMMYYQSWYNPGLSVAPVMPPSFAPQIVGNAHPQQQVPHIQEAAAANNGAQEAARPNVRMNAQGGMEEDDDDDGEPRDWLHHMYFFMRVLTFLGILFFYSNVTRFLTVFTGSFAIYILQKFRKYWQRTQQQQQQQMQQQQQQEQQQNEQNEQPQQQQDVPADVRNEEVQEEPLVPETGGDPQPAVEEDGSRVTRIMTFICNTVQAFFTSLLPTPPELLERN